MGFTCCVIGGGPAGIAATLAMRRAGAMVTCMELNSTVGGIWATAHGPTAGTHGGSLPGSGYSAIGARGLLSPIYPSMRCVIPKDAMAYSDHRFSFLVPSYPHYAAVHEYLQDYASSKGVHGLVRYNTWVEKVEWLGEERTEVNPDYITSLTSAQRQAERRARGEHQRPQENVWLVRTVNVVNGDVTEWKFDCVVVATGRHHRPRMPDPFSTKEREAQPNAPRVLPPLPGQMRYIEAGGQVLHSSEVKRFRDWTGKTVVVYGNGVSAFDYVKELQRAGAMVVHATEREPTAADDSNTDNVCDTVLPPTPVDRFKALLMRFDPTQNPKFVANLLSRRNTRLRQSLRATLHSPTGFGEYDKAAGTWLRDFYRGSQPHTEGETKAGSVAPTMAEALEALRGAYAAVPVLADINRFGKAEATAPAAAASSKASAAPSEAKSEAAAPNNEAGEEEPSAMPQLELNDRDVVVNLTHLVAESTGAAASGGSAGSVFGAAATAAADAVADASLTTGVNRLSSMHAPTRLLNMIRKAEYSPYDPRSVALLSRFGLARERAGSGEVTGLVIKGCDAVICCTGYYQSFAFLADQTIRSDVEFSSRYPQLQLNSPHAAAEKAGSLAADDDAERQRVTYNGLYMGTLLRRNPTLAFVGMQAEMVPAFIMFEAQAAYIAAAMTARVPIPATDKQMTQRELELGLPHRKLAATSGIGIGGSALYYQGLLREAGLAATHYGYYETMWTARRPWFMGTWLVQGVHGLWSLTPQQRKKQHTIISNDI